MAPHYIECFGRCEVLRVEHDYETNTVDLAIFRNHPTKHGWRSRLRCIWRMFRTGEPFGDDMILDKDGVAKLVAALTPPEPGK